VVSVPRMQNENGLDRACPLMGAYGEIFVNEPKISDWPEGIDSALESCYYVIDTVIDNGNGNNCALSDIKPGDSLS
jgi:hypothetical protein